MLKAELILLGLVILLISTGALADEGVPEKPEDWDRQLDMLRSVPYLAFSETAVGEGDTGVVYYDPQKACAGYNFYCSKSSGEAFLMDMESRLVHRWRYSLKGAGEDRTVLLANGDIMVMVTFHELLRLNWHSQLLWKKELDVHHDLAQLPDGSFYVIVRDHKDYRGLKVKFAAIEHLTADGEEIDRWSTYDRLAEVMDTWPR
jgi:hypothetical protein